MYSYGEDIANILDDQYRETFSTRKFTSEERAEYTESDSAPRYLDNIEITQNDVLQSLEMLSIISSAGSDGIPAIVLKKRDKTLAFPLVKLWGASMQPNSIPCKTKLGIITPINKGGNKGLPKNYRPVSTTSHIIKTFERIVA